MSEKRSSKANGIVRNSLNILNPQRSDIKPAFTHIGQQKPDKWLYRDFILGYFGKRESSAQKGYQNFVKMYLCQRYSGQKLKGIGLHFGIGESGVSQACRRVAQKIEKDKKLKKKIVKLEKQIDLSRMKT